MKLKVTALTAAVILIILLALDSFIYLTLREHVMQEESTLLQTRVQTVSQGVQQGLESLEGFGGFSDGYDMVVHEIEKYVQQQAPESILVTQIVGQSNVVVKGVGKLSTGQMVNVANSVMTDQSNPSNSPDGDEERPKINVVQVGSEEYMVVSAQVRSHVMGTVGSVYLFADLGRLLDYLHTLLTALLLGSIGAVLVGAGGGYAVSSAAAKPINQMIRLVARIQAGKINERIPLPKGHDEVARLAATFNQMLDRIERSFQQQAQFVADASHEIRTPLTTIQGYAQLLGRWGKEDPAILEKAISVIQKESGRLRTLTNDMLTLADMESSRQLLGKTCDVQSTIAEILEPYELLHPDHPITFHSPDSVVVAMAPEHFGRVLTNLVSNAIKYSPDGGRVKVTVTASNKEATIAVEDEGQGIPAEDLPRIFDRFYRVDKARSRQAGGNGLGLAIVKELVEMYQGKIWATSVVGEGTSVMFTLPRTTEGTKHGED